MAGRWRRVVARWWDPPRGAAPVVPGRAAISGTTGHWDIRRSVPVPSGHGARAARPARALRCRAGLGYGEGVCEPAASFLDGDDRVVHPAAADLGHDQHEPPRIRWEPIA